MKSSYKNKIKGILNFSWVKAIWILWVNEAAEYIKQAFEHAECQTQERNWVSITWKVSVIPKNPTQNQQRKTVHRNGTLEWKVASIILLLLQMQNKQNQ